MKIKKMQNKLQDFYEVNISEDIYKLINIIDEIILQRRVKDVMLRVELRSIQKK